MIRFSHVTLAALAAIALSACGAPPPPAPSPPAALQDPAAQAAVLGSLVERYWAESAALMPWYSWGGGGSEFAGVSGENIAPQSLADSLALEQRYLAEVEALPRSSLNPESQLTYDIFRRERSLAIEGFTYPAELLPVNPYDGMPERFALMESAAERLGLASAKDFDNWRRRSESLVGWMNQAVLNLRDGMRRGYTLPHVLVDKALAPLAALGADTEQNLFYQSMRAGVGAGDNAGRVRFTAEMRAQIKDKILPSYRALHEFLLREYLPRSRSSVGLSALPLGDAWYAYLVKRAAGGQSAAQLHVLGQVEIDRLHQRVLTLLAEAGFAGNAQSYYERMRNDPRYAVKSPAELLTAYQELKVQVAAAVPTLFPRLPRAEFAIRAVEPFREEVTPDLSYVPRPPNGMIAAALYVNTAKLEAHPAIPVTAQYLRESVPGRHVQTELQRERADLPRVRRFGAAPAFVEGWALYAATLGEELGLYRDPEAKFGSLLAQMACAAAMVVDTGLHAQGWTRQQALEYLRAQVPMDDAVAAGVVDRAIARPADALACTVGYLKIQGLRNLAQQTLGSRFDVRAFHTEVLKDGAMPLELLDAKVKRWIEAGGPGPPDKPE